MDAFWQTSTFFGIFITLFFYGVGMFLKQKVKHTLVNPLLIAIVFTILFLHLFGIDYKTYNNSAKYISYLMTPATICLAVPLYRQLDTSGSRPALLLPWFRCWPFPGSSD